MPMYEYKCPECGHKLEDYKPMSKSDEKTICPECGEEMDRYYGDQMFWNADEE